MRDKRHKKLHFVYFDAIFLFSCEQNVEHIYYEHLISQEERETWSQGVWKTFCGKVWNQKYNELSQWCTINLKDLMLISLIFLTICTKLCIISSLLVVETKFINKKIRSWRKQGLPDRVQNKQKSS